MYKNIDMTIRMEINILNYIQKVVNLLDTLIKKAVKRLDQQRQPE